MYNIAKLSNNDRDIVFTKYSFDDLLFYIKQIEREINNLK